MAERVTTAKLGQEFHKPVLLPNLFSCGTPLCSYSDYSEGSIKIYIDHVQVQIIFSPPFPHDIWKVSEVISWKAEGKDAGKSNITYSTSW